jgi:heat shock protein HspQ
MAARHGGKAWRQGGAAPQPLWQRKKRLFYASGVQDMKPRQAKFTIGQVVRHRVYPFRGVIFDVDPVFANTEEWWLSIPEDVRPRKDQPFYHLLAENEENEYIAYVSEQNLLPDRSGLPLRHPQIEELFEPGADGQFAVKNNALLN